MIWEPFVMALVLGLLVSAGLYFAYLWPSVEPLDEDEAASAPPAEAGPAAEPAAASDPAPAAPAAEASDPPPAAPPSVPA